MSNKIESLLKGLVKYGDSGSSENFELARISLEMHSLTGKSANIPVSTALKVAKHMINIIYQHNNVTYSVQSWNCLAVLCDRELNSKAFDLLTELQATNVLSLVTRSISTLSNEFDLEAEFCYKFLSLFTRIDGTRQILVGQTQGIIETHLILMDTMFNNSRNNLKIALLNVLTNILGRNALTSRVNTDKFVNGDGFRIVNAIFQNVASWAKDIALVRGFIEEESSVIHSCLMCLSSVYSSLTRVDFRHVAHAHREKHQYSAAGLTSTTAALHSFFAVSTELKFKDASLITFVNFCEYVRARMPEMLQGTLLFAGNSNSATTIIGVPFVIQFLRISRDERLNHMTDTVMSVLGKYGGMYSAVNAIIDPELNNFVGFVPQVGPDANVCAYPGCKLNSINCSALKKCSRCKAVCYCGKEHQTMHWKIHKKLCVQV